MKGILKWVIVIGILVAIFGGTTVKKYLNIGLNQSIDGIEYGVSKIKKNNIKTPVGSIINSIQDLLPN